MYYDEKLIKTLEFDKILNTLASLCTTEKGKEKALSTLPSDRKEIIEKKQQYVTDAKKLYDNKGTPSIFSCRDMSGVCDLANKGATLSAKDLLDVAKVLKTARSMLEYIRTNKLFDTSLDEIFERFLENKKVEDKIFSAIISEDMIADDASPTLSEIRRKMRVENNRIKETLSKYVSDREASKYLQENIITMRNGRYVVPVKVECKNEVKGLIHDTSSTGATIFVEPAGVVEANNELRILQSKEEHEIERILYELSSFVSEISRTVEIDFLNIAEIDYYFACASFSAKMNAMSPTFVDEKRVVLNKARHPLIDKEKVVPINLKIDDGNDTLIITGPNTGGKTVTLKTLGLFALMAQSGLHIPTAEDSVLPIFDGIFADIGDAQSIEMSLSTFSSHMVNIVSMLKNVTNCSLVLFDELCAGTDPIEGAALAVSIIEKIRQNGAICMATTHYAELKVYALNENGVCNASCEFDVSTLKPTYKLIIGSPGKSNAFAISKKLGLSSEIVDNAEKLLGNDERSFESVIEKLEKTRIELEKEKEKAIKDREEFEIFKQNSETEIKKNLSYADKQLEKSKLEADAIVKSARASSDYILREMDELRKKKDKANLSDEIQKTRQKVKDYIRQNEDKYNPLDRDKNENYKLPRELKVGDEVFIVTLGKNGFLKSLPDKSGNVNISVGIITTKTNIKNLRLVENVPTFTDNSGKKIKTNDYKLSANRSVSQEIDIRGMMGDEGWQKVDKYIDEVMLAGLHTAYIIHGKGTGALKKAIWEHLKKDDRLKSFRIGQYGEGDGGVTVIELK